jgi:tRNA(Ile)-lysidine synthase
LHIPGDLLLAGGWRLSAETILEIENARLQAYTNDDPYQAWLDGSVLSPPVLVRGRQPGDRFRPLGMEGHSMKLADFLVNVKLPQRARAAWPLVCSQDEILWVPGFGLAHPARLHKDTINAIKLKLTKD